MLRKLALGAALGAGLVAVPIQAHENEKEENHAHKTITEDQLPAPVRSALQREAKGKRIESIKQETERNGETRYEAEVISGNKGTVLEFDENGKVVERRHHDESKEKEHEGR